VNICFCIGNVLAQHLLRHDVQVLLLAVVRTLGLQNSSVVKHYACCCLCNIRCKVEVAHAPHGEHMLLIVAISESRLLQHLLVMSKHGCHKCKEVFDHKAACFAASL